MCGGLFRCLDYREPRVMNMPKVKENGNASNNARFLSLWFILAGMIQLETKIFIRADQPDDASSPE